MKCFSKLLAEPQNILIPLFIFAVSILIKVLLFYFTPISYDETAYAKCAYNIASHGGWFNLYNSKDLFFFPPLFNWLGALLILAGFEQLAAVRTVSILTSSGIPVLIFLLIKRSGLPSKTAIFTALIWIILPGVIYYSIVGQAETSFLFFALLSAYFMSGNRDKTVNVLLSAFFLSASVWFKETAIGFVPVFIFMFVVKKEFGNVVKWLITFTLFSAPLFAQTFFPHSYDLFYELSNDLISWNSVSIYYPFFYLATLVGFHSFNPVLSNIITWVAALIVLSSSIIAFIRFRSVFIIRFSLLSNLVFIIFFIFFPKKFEYYLLPILLFSLILLCSVIPKSKSFRIFLAAAFTLLSINGLMIRSSDWDNYRNIRMLLTTAAFSAPGSTIGTPTPHLAEYIADSTKINVKIVPLDFFSGYDPENCRKKQDRCILENDYFLADDEFFTVLFCKNWPVKIEKCDLESMRKVLEKMEKIDKKSVFTLYHIKKKK